MSVDNDFVTDSLAAAPPHLRELVDFLGELNRESERGAVLISASMIDELLRRSLLAIFIQHKAAEKLLDGFNAPLGTFAARIKTAFCVGFLSEREYNDCEIIRDIRNRFAHDIRVRFTDQRIAALCSRLSHDLSDHANAKREETQVQGYPRTRLTSAAMSLIFCLTNRPIYAGQRRLTFSPWPVAAPSRP